MRAKDSREAGLAVDDLMAAALDNGGDRTSDTGHTVVQLSFDKEAKRHIRELKLWEQRSETVDLELVGRH